MLKLFIIIINIRQLVLSSSQEQNFILLKEIESKNLNQIKVLPQEKITNCVNNATNIINNGNTQINKTANQVLT